MWFKELASSHSNSAWLKPYPYLSFENTDSDVVLKAENYKLSCKGDYARLVETVLRNLDNYNCFETLAIKTGVNKELLVTMLENLYEIGIIFNASNININQKTFIRHLIGYGTIQCSKHKSQFEKLKALSPEKAKELLLGYMLEAWCFVKGSRRHIAQAILSASTEHREQILCDYLSQEYWHPNLLLCGLKRAGITNDFIKNYVPTSETSSLINLLEKYAREDIETYVICLGIAEGSSNKQPSFSAVKYKWEKIKLLGLFPNAVYEPFIEHEELDLVGKHADIYEAFVEEDKYYDSDRQHEIKEKINEFIEAQALAYSSVETRYG